MKASQLRDLTRRYAAGKLDREEYLAERAQLIDGIVAGNIEIRYRVLEPAEAGARAPVAQKQWLFAGGSIMLVGLLLVALLTYFLDDHAAPEPPAIAEAVVDPGVDLLRQFLKADDWSNSAVQQLENDWGALTPFHQESARRSANYRRLKHETVQRIHEQEALLATGEMEALLQATRLREFAERLNMPLEN